MSEHPVTDEWVARATPQEMREAIPKYADEINRLAAALEEALEELKKLKGE